MQESSQEEIITDTSVPAELDNDQYRYSAECLGNVVSLQEAAWMWQIPANTLSAARLRLKLDGRKTLTGGTILLSVASMIIAYGEPKFDPLQKLKKGQS